MTYFAKVFLISMTCHLWSFLLLGNSYNAGLVCFSGHKKHKCSDINDMKDGSLNAKRDGQWSLGVNWVSFAVLHTGNLNVGLQSAMNKFCWGFPQVRLLRLAISVRLQAEVNMTLVSIAFDLKLAEQFLLWFK